MLFFTLFFQKIPPFPLSCKKNLYVEIKKILDVILKSYNCSIT